MKSRKKVTTTLKLLVILIASSASAAFCEAKREDGMNYFRLPKNTIPRFYNISIDPNVDGVNLSWTGMIVVRLELMHPDKILTLHSGKNLRIDQNFTHLVDVNGAEFIPDRHDRDDRIEFLKLIFNREIPAGNYSLFLNYDGFQDDKNIGLIRSSDGITGSPRVVVAYMQPTGARRVFPCFDEPALKARFSISIKHYSNYTVASNMPEATSLKTADGKILTTFDETPIMSTYLLNFVIADYEVVHNEHRNVSLYGSSRSFNTTRHMIDLSAKVVRVMESYTGFSFGVPRIGAVLAPSYKSATNEQWGLITYREGYVSFNASKDTIQQKDEAEKAIVHQLVHSWFGNRVTPLWWNDVWLSEAFTTYFSYFIRDQIYDRWGGSELSVLDHNHIAFFDDNDGAMPIKWTPETTDEISEVVSSFPYVKGPAIVSMFRHVLGDKVFQAGIQNFMTKHSFGSADTSDLMAAFQKAYDEGPNRAKTLNVSETMTPWLVQSGFPVINVRRNYTTGETEMCQKYAFHESGGSKKWWIPLTYATKSNPNPTSTLPASWISNKDDCVKIEGIDKDDWILVNVRASGYYRVNYDDENWNRLCKYLNSDNYTNINVLNRAQMISDIYHLITHNSTRYYEIFYKLTKYLSREIEYLPWLATHRVVKHISDNISHTGCLKQFKEYFSELMRNYVEKVGFEVNDTDDHFTKLSRTDVIRWACISGHVKCSEQAAMRLMKFMEDPVKNRLHPDVVFLTFCAGLRGLNDTAANQFLDWAYINEKELLVSYVGCTENHEIHRKILKYPILEPMTEESEYVILVLLESSDENYNFTVDLLLEEFKVIEKSFDVPARELITLRILFSISRETTNSARLEKFKELVNSLSMVNSELISQYAEDKVRSVEDQAHDTCKFLESAVAKPENSIESRGNIRRNASINISIKIE